MKTIARAAFLVIAISGACFAQTSTNVTPESATVAAHNRLFEAAYAKGDVKALSELFTADAEYTTDDGRTFHGWEALQDVLLKMFKENKGATAAILTDSVRPLGPEVVVEKGSTTVTFKSGDEASSLFTAVYVKQGGQLKINQLVETPLPEIPPGEHLAELAWLMGEWEEADEVENLTIHSVYQWAKGGSFITRNVTVKRGDDPMLEGWQIIGWDPLAKAIRSWTFDGAGGYSDGSWTREGQRWLIREAGYSGDGSATTAEQTITKTGEDRFYWESNNRTLDGDPLPGIGRIQILRAKGK